MSPVGPSLDWYYGRQVTAVEESPKFVIELTGKVKIISHDPPVPAADLVGRTFQMMILGGTPYSTDGNTTELVFYSKEKGTIRVSLTAGFYEILDPRFGKEPINPQRGPLPEVNVSLGVSSRLIDAAVSAKPMTQEELEAAEKAGEIAVHSLHGQRAPELAEADEARREGKSPPSPSDAAEGSTARPTEEIQ